MDSVGRSSSLRAFSAALVILIAALLPGAALAQSPHSDASPQDASGQSADALLSRGLALAQAQRWADAEQVFREGILRFHDPRFHEELAGVAYRQKRFSQAKQQLRRAIQLGPRDTYASDFLASIYFQESNLEAALKYWNRADRPKLNDLTFVPKPAIAPLIIDRTLSFSPGSLWTLNDHLRVTEQLSALELFPIIHYELRPVSDGSFALTLRSPERQGLEHPGLFTAISTLSGLPYQTVYPEFYDLNGSGINVISLVRWDAEKRRLSLTVGGPVRHNPAKRLEFYLDARNENWNLRDSTSSSPVAFNLERLVTGIVFTPQIAARWRWTVGAEFSDRRFRSLSGVTQSSSVFANTSGVALRVGAQRSLIRHPERRFVLDGNSSVEFGTFTSSSLGQYSVIQGGIRSEWFPKASGEDLRTFAQLRVGSTTGDVPFDRLFELGFDRDNDLSLRGHNALSNGIKGNAPLGRRFVLVNSEFDKVVLARSLFTLKAGPFLDTGKIYAPALPLPAASPWLVDVGAQAKLRVLGVEVVLGYGRDLRGGGNTFFSTVAP